MIFLFYLMLCPLWFEWSSLP